MWRWVSEKQLKLVLIRLALASLVVAELLLFVSAQRSRKVEFGMEIGLMIEGQEGLTWENWLDIAMTCEDHISGGRVEVGMGAGWYGAEHEQFGFSFPQLEQVSECSLSNWK